VNKIDKNLCCHGTYIPAGEALTINTKTSLCDMLEGAIGKNKAEKKNQ
jgi:hypothetical protein